MSEKLAFTVNIDRDVKEKADAVLAKAGLTLEGVVAALAGRIAANGALPFELSLIAPEKDAKAGEGEPENATALARAATSILSSLVK